MYTFCIGASNFIKYVMFKVKTWIQKIAKLYFYCILAIITIHWMNMITWKHIEFDSVRLKSMLKNLKAEYIMKTVEFYRGERPNPSGTYGYEMMKFSHFTMEVEHDWIQYLFPTNEPSQFENAPIMTKEESDIFKQNIKLQERMLASFEKILDFFGFKLKVDSSVFIILDLQSTNERPYPRDWLDYFNHNMLRVTRVLKCLRLTGLDEYARLFYEALKRHKDKVNKETWEYWEEATFGELWT